MAGGSTSDAVDRVPVGLIRRKASAYSSRAVRATAATGPPLSPALKRLAMQLAGHRAGLSRPYPGVPERRRR